MNECCYCVVHFCSFWLHNGKFCSHDAHGFFSLLCLFPDNHNWDAAFIKFCSKLFPVQICGSFSLDTLTNCLRNCYFFTFVALISSTNCVFALLACISFSPPDIFLDILLQKQTFKQFKSHQQNYCQKCLIFSWHFFISWTLKKQSVIWMQMLWVSLEWWEFGVCPQFALFVVVVVCNKQDACKWMWNHWIFSCFENLLERTWHKAQIKKWRL